MDITHDVSGVIDSYDKGRRVVRVVQSNGFRYTIDNNPSESHFVTWDQLQRYLNHRYVVIRSPFPAHVRLPLGV